MADYVFLTRWEFAAPIAAVWGVIDDPGSWPSWWAAVRSVEALDKGDAGGIGSVLRMRFRAPLGYTLGFDVRTSRREAPRILEAESVGELSGAGKWSLAETDNGTAVFYLWQVSTSKVWMNVLAPVARPLFNWNHDRIMIRGGEGLARQLGSSIVASDNLSGAGALAAWEARGHSRQS